VQQGCGEVQRLVIQQLPLLASCGGQQAKEE